MAIYYSDQYTIMRAGELLPVSDWGGKLRIMNFNFIAQESITALDLIVLVKLPPGRVIFQGAQSWKNYYLTPDNLDIYIGWGEYKAPTGVTVAGDAFGIDGGDNPTEGSAPQGSIMGNDLPNYGRRKVFESSTGVDIVVSSDAIMAATNFITGHVAYTLD